MIFKNNSFDNSVENNKLKIKIFVDLKPIDWLSLNQVYAPIIGNEAYFLYTTIYFQKHIFNHLNICEYPLNELLINLKISFKKFKNLLKELEEYKLIKLSINNNEIENIVYLLKLFAPMSINNALKNEQIKNKLRIALNSDKFSEINLLTENDDVGCDLDLNENNCLIQQSESNEIINLIIDKDTYCEFYDGVFKEIDKEFVVPDEVLEIIKIYHIEEKTISIKKMQKFAILSIKTQNSKDFICPDSFLFLINSELNKNQKSFAETEYDAFWKNLILVSDSENKKQFKKLFFSFSTLDFYLKFTNKQKIPTGMEKWIKDCVKNKNFKYEILNGIISFVKTLLKKIPINYLIKMTDNLFNDGVHSVDQFLEHIKNVLENELKTKNRLNIKISDNSLNENLSDKFLDD